MVNKTLGFNRVLVEACAGWPTRSGTRSVAKLLMLKKLYALHKETKKANDHSSL